MSEEDLTTVQRILNLLQNSKLTESPTSDLVLEYLIEILKYFEESIAELICKDDLESKILRYINSGPGASMQETDLFRLYQLLRNILAISGAWQNLAITDIVQPTPKRTTVICKLFSTVLNPVFIETLGVAQKICEQGYKDKADSDSYAVTYRTLQENLDANLNFLKEFREKEAKYKASLKEIDEKLKTFQLEDDHELIAAQAELAKEEALYKQNLEKLKKMQEKRKELSEEIVSDEEYEECLRQEKSLKEELDALIEEEQDCNNGLDAKHEEKHMFEKNFVVLGEYEASISNLEEVAAKYERKRGEIQEEMQRFEEMNRAVNDILSQKEEIEKKIEARVAKHATDEKSFREEIQNLQKKVDEKRRCIENCMKSCTDTKKMANHFNTAIVALEKKLQEKEVALEEAQRGFLETLNNFVLFKETLMEDIRKL